MTPTVIEALSKISTPLGLGGLALFVLLVIARRILTPSFLPKLAKSHAFVVIKLLVDRSFVLAALAIVLGFIGYMTVIFFPMTTSENATLADVLIEKKNGEHSATLDFRVVNGTKNDLLITKIRLDPIKSERDCRIGGKGFMDYTKKYDFQDIGELEPSYGKPQDIPISQVIIAGKSDRFGIEVGDTDPRCTDHYWKFKAFLVTSAGVIGGQVMELRLK